MSNVHFLPPRPARPADFAEPHEPPAEKPSVPASVAELHRRIDLLTTKVTLLAEFADVLVRRLQLAIDDGRS